jgi:hypothetical protein
VLTSSRKNSPVRAAKQWGNILKRILSLPNRLLLSNAEAVRQQRKKIDGKGFIATALTVAFTGQSLLSVLPQKAWAASSGNSDSYAAPPSGTLLLPLTPKLDTAPATSNQESASDQNDMTATKSQADADELLPSVETVSAEKGKIEGEIEDDKDTTGSDTTLKGTVQIVADDTEFDQNANTFLGTGNAVAIIGGENSKLEADSILYDQNDQTIDARGNVRILRNGQLTTGSAFKFKVTSDEYLITKPDTEITGSEIIARKGFGTKDGLNFQNGTISMPSPFFFVKNYNIGPLSYRESIMTQKSHPDGYLPQHPSFRFRAKRMVYERYKENDNVTIFGGRVEVGSFSIPVGKITATVGQTDTKVVIPTTPYLGGNLYTGGFNVGPQFNTGIGKTGVLSWSPMINLGGRNLATNSNTSGLGLAARVAYTAKDFQTHLAYGSNSNLLVGDIKAKLYKSIRLQAGVNRFLDDGMMGLTRARLMAEVKDVHQITTIPYIGLLQFRSSAGWAQDNPLLVNVSSTNAQLHGSPTSSVMKSAYRVQEQITVTSHPIFSIGDDKYGAKSFLYGGTALRGYSTGDASLIGQFGPILDLRLNRLRMQTGYTNAAVRGASPFVFDEFVQGTQSVYAIGDVRVNRYLTLGTLIGYNLTAKLAYAKQLQAAIGPPDAKLLIGRDFVLNNYRVGFNILHGEPVPFDKLVLKGTPDQGQLGGI